MLFRSFFSTISISHISVSWAHSSIHQSVFPGELNSDFQICLHSLESPSYCKWDLSASTRQELAWTPLEQVRCGKGGDCSNQRSWLSVVFLESHKWACLSQLHLSCMLESRFSFSSVLSASFLPFSPGSALLHQELLSAVLHFFSLFPSRKTSPSQLSMSVTAGFSISPKSFLHILWKTAPSEGDGFFA